MAWLLTTMSSVFNQQLADANALIASAQAGLNALPEDEMNAILTDAQNQVLAASNFVAQLESSGLSTLALLPASGGWPNRLLQAPSAPPNDAGMYSAVVATIFVSASLESVTDAYDTMKSALTEPMRIKETKPTAMASAELVDEGQSNWMAENIWSNLTVGDLLPAQMVAAKNALGKAKKALTLAQNAMQSLTAKKNDLEEALSEAQAVVSGFASTGIYNLILSPALGGWHTRMTNEGSAPSTDTSYYSSGTVTVIQGADLTYVTDRFNQLMAAMK